MRKYFKSFSSILPPLIIVCFLMYNAPIRYRDTDIPYSRGELVAVKDILRDDPGYFLRIAPYIIIAIIVIVCVRLAIKKFKKDWFDN